MATDYGANALGWRDLGRIEVDAKADLVLVNLETIRMSPVRDPIRNLIYGATDQDMNRVIIDGKTVVKDGEVLGMDEHVVTEELQQSETTL